jgi:membrane protease YdiL (CAAX protease family)
MEIERRLPVADALLAFPLALALLLLLSPLAAWPWAYAAIQILAIGLPSLALAARRGRPLERLGLTWPRPGALAGAALLGASTWCLVLIAVEPLIDALAERWSMFDPSRLEELERLVAETPWPLLALSFATLPAICEELLFRGALARSVAGRLGRGWGVVVSAILFGLFHLEPIRMLPTALLGLVLGYTAIVSGSTIPAMVVHLLNNGLAIALERAGTEGLERHAAVVTAMAGIGFLGGIALIWRNRPV